MSERYVYCGGLRAGHRQPDALTMDVNAPVGEARHDPDDPNGKGLAPTIPIQDSCQAPRHLV
jgi:hypothetical protein